MRLTAIFLLSACLQVSAKSGAQRITLSLKNAPLEKVFTEINKQTGYSFVYNNNLIADAKKVTITVTSAPVEEVLEMAFKEQPLTYQIIDKTIIVKPAIPNEQAITINNEPPPIDITGKVTDEHGNLLVGASVKVKGTNKGTTTGNDGMFELKGVDANATLEISYVGFQTITIAVNKRTTIIASLKINDSPLDEMQVIAYGTRKVREQTGNVTTVKGTDIQKQPVSNPLQALEGRVPGLYITQKNGLPGSGITVRVEGQNSVLGGNDPLYVIDGVPYVAQTLVTATVGLSLLNSSTAGGYQPGGAGNPLAFINPDDIESIEVLKDADATSIYGSRAANGAILITTKKGKAGATNINLNMQQGWNKISRGMKMMNTQQYLEMRKEALRNDNRVPNPLADYDLTLWDQNKNTNWEKVFYKTGKFTNLNGTVSGGSSTVQYLIGSTYHQETSPFSNDPNEKKADVHFNITSSSLNRKFGIEFTGSYLSDNIRLPQVSFGSSVYATPPNAPSFYNPDGSLNWAPDPVGNSSWLNPLAGLYNKYENKTDNLNTSGFVRYHFSTALELGTRLGYSKLHTDEFSSISILSQKPEQRSRFVRSANYSYNDQKIYSVEPQLNYKKQWNQFNVDGLLGVSIQQNIGTGQNLSGTGYPTDDLEKDIRSATSINVTSTFDAVYKYNALFGRVTGNWKGKYILDLSARRDGSSHFGPKNRFHNFASVGGAWIFSEEGLFKHDLQFISFGKLRASYGTSGNDQVGDYTYMDLYSPVNYSLPYQGLPSVIATKLSSPYLQWEETKKLSVGLSFSFFKNRIRIDANYSRNRCSNELIGYQLPSIAGFFSVDKNFPATVQNTSWEFSLNTVNIKTKTIEWNTSFNATVPKNTLLSFPNLKSSSYANFLKIGEPINGYRYYRFAGVNPATGTYQFFDANNNVTGSPSYFDRTAWISTEPVFYGGLQNDFKWKNFELDALFQFVKKVGPTNVFGLYNPPGSYFTNQPAFIANRWQKPGDIVTIQRYNSNYSLYNGLSNAGQSDAGYQDASFIRLKNASVYYSIPKAILRRIHLQQCRFYMQGQNLLTFTNYKGGDPESTSLDLPPLKVWTVGIQVGF